MFSPLGKYIINISDDIFMNLIACSIIGSMAYLISYSITGSVYANGLISTRAGGSLVHCLIRIPLFIMMAYLVRDSYFIFRVYFKDKTELVKVPNGTGNRFLFVLMLT